MRAAGVEERKDRPVRKATRVIPATLGRPEMTDLPAATAKLAPKGVPANGEKPGHRGRPETMATTEAMGRLERPAPLLTKLRCLAASKETRRNGLLRWLGRKANLARLGKPARLERRANPAQTEVTATTVRPALMARTG